MADKMECPACNAYLSSVCWAYRNGEDCPECGFPHDAHEAFLAAQARGADATLNERLVLAEKRAAEAERELAVVRSKLSRIGGILGPEVDHG